MNPISDIQGYMKRVRKAIKKLSKKDQLVVIKKVVKTLEDQASFMTGMYNGISNKNLTEILMEESLEDQKHLREHGINKSEDTK